MTRLTNRIALCGIAALAAMLAWTTSSASVKATQTPHYGRFHFGFDKPTRLKASVSGTTATLQFEQPVHASGAEIAAALPGYVKAAKISPDGKRVTMTLAKPYHLRQFVSGATVGVDLVGTADPKAPKAKPIAPQPTEKKPAATPQKVTATAAAAKDTKPEPPAKTADALLTTKKDTPPPANSDSGVEKKPANSSEDMLSTKAAAKPEVSSYVASDTAPAHEAEPTTATPEREMLTTKEPTATPPAPTAEESPATPTKPAAETPPAPEAPAQAEPTLKPKGSEQFIVTTKTTAGETTIQFPWQSRTAAAVYRRANDIWVIFSGVKDLNAKLLSSTLPTSVIGATQFNMPRYTVLRLATNGKINARAEQVKNSFGWNVVLSAEASPPLNDTSVAVDTLENGARLILGVYDTAAALKFYDPSVGDSITVVPTYENQRGVATQRTYPQLSLLNSNQGIVIVGNRNDISVAPSRSGLVISIDVGLSISESLPTVGGAKIPAPSAHREVMIPYEQWYVPHDAYLSTLSQRLHAIASATKDAKPEALFELLKLYMSEGMAPESSGILDILKSDYPTYYAENKLALLHTAAHVLMQRFDEAAKDLAAPELADSDEAMLWRQLVAVYMPPTTTADAIQQAIEAASNAAPPPAPATTNETNTAQPPHAEDTATNHSVFQLLKYNKSYIRFYPPRIRQQLTVLAAEAYMRDGQFDKAVASYDILVRDGISAPIKRYVDYAVAIAATNDQNPEQAIEMLEKLAKQRDDVRIAALSRFEAAKLKYEKGKMSAEDAAEEIEHARMSWRGDEVEHAMLNQLVILNIDAKRYDEVLRDYKALIDGFPNDPKMLETSSQMSQLFRRIYLEDLAQNVSPIKALSLFYEFRELTPLGPDGDRIIQSLADKLASVDLLDRAAQLLEHQIKYRITAADRARVGARLALLYLLNKKPQEALDILEVTNYGDSDPELTAQRQEFTAQALSSLGKHEEALSIIYNDTTPAASKLRLDILWAMQDWPNVINRAEDILNARPNLTDPLNNKETEVLLKLALAYAFENDPKQLRYLRDYYSGLIPDSGYKHIFDFITNDTAPLDPEDFALVSKQISRTEDFLATFKSKIAEGKLSEAVK